MRRKLAEEINQQHIALLTRQLKSKPQDDLKGCKIWGFPPDDCPQFGSATCPATCSRFEDEAEIAELKRQTTAELKRIREMDDDAHRVARIYADLRTEDVMKAKPIDCKTEDAESNEDAHQEATRSYSEFTEMPQDADLLEKMARELWEWQGRNGRQTAVRWDEIVGARRKEFLDEAQFLLDEFVEAAGYKSPEEVKLMLNPDYLDFRKGVAEGRKLERVEMVEWPVLPDEEIAQTTGHTMNYLSYARGYMGKLRQVAEAQRDADMERCPAQEGKKTQGINPKPVVVCLCGSTRFVEAFQREYARLSDEGNIVLTVNRLIPEHNLPPEQEHQAHELHFRKIELADELFILNVGGYIGPQLKVELAYAQKIGKPVRYLESLS